MGSCVAACLEYHDDTCGTNSGTRATNSDLFTIGYQRNMCQPTFNVLFTYDMFNYSFHLTYRYVSASNLKFVKMRIMWNICLTIWYLISIAKNCTRICVWCLNGFALYSCEQNSVKSQAKFIFSFRKLHLKMSTGIWRRFCLGFNILNGRCLTKLYTNLLFETYRLR